MNYVFELLRELQHKKVGYMIGRSFNDYCHKFGLETLVGYPEEYHKQYLEEFIDSIRKGFRNDKID